MAAKEAAVSEAAKATTRENFMLELMNEASLDMAGMPLQTKTSSIFPLFPPLKFLCCRQIGSFLDAAAEDQRVDARTNLLVNLSLDHGSLFWATPYLSNAKATERGLREILPIASRSWLCVGSGPI
jgi:hypothetical protein